MKGHCKMRKTISFTESTISYAQSSYPASNSHNRIVDLEYIKYFCLNLFLIDMKFIQ